MSLERFHWRRGEVLRALSDLRGVSADLGAKSLAARIGLEVIQKLEADRFHLVVVGEFNHGKSTFVNALLGQSLLPVGVTPTTAVIHHLVHAETAYAKVVTKEGEEPLSLEGLRTWAASEGASERSAKVRYIEVGVPAKLLEERVVLVDTPGVNDLSLQRADITYKYIPQSDAVLFLLDAGQLIKESERVFLIDKLIGKSRDKIIFVVNKADIWSPAERDEAMAYVREQLGKLVKSPIVFPISAQAATAGDAEKGGLQPLLDHLSRFLPEERGRLVLDHALAEGIALATMLEQGVFAKRHALRMSVEDLDRRIGVVSRDAEGQLSTIDQRRAHIREEVSAIRAWARRDLDVFCEDVARMLPGVIDEASSDDLQQHLASFLESTFKTWAMAETKEIAEALEKVAERTVAMLKEDAEGAAKRLGDALNVKAPRIDIDTFAYDVGIFAMFTIGISTIFANVMLGGLLTLAAPLLALYVKGKVAEETKKKAKELAPQALRDAAFQVGPKLDGMIDDFARELDAWVLSTGKEMYREMLEVLTAARDEKKGRKDGDAVAEQALTAQETRLAEVKTQLEKLRTDLWVAEAEHARVAMDDRTLN